MKTTTHGSYLIKLTRLFVINCYLVREDDGFTVVDTGMGGSEKGILAAAEALGAPIKRITVTHAHADHVGSLDALHAALPDAEVIYSERSARLLGGDFSLDADEAQSKLRGGITRVTTKATRLVRPGDRIGSLEVVASPGHTPDHVAFLDTRDRTLIAGDALQTQGGLAVMGVIKPLFPLPAFATWDKPTALESARALRALEPSRLAVGHGRVLEAPVAAMDEAIAEAARRFGTA